MRLLQANQNQASSAFANFFAERSIKRPSPIESGSTPITHHLTGATLTFDPAELNKLNNSITQLNELNIAQCAQVNMLDSQSLLERYAEKGLLSKLDLESIAHAGTPIKAMEALGNALDEPALSFAAMGNKTLQSVKDFFHKLNLPHGMMHDIFNHPLLGFSLVEDRDDYSESLSWNLICSGELEPLLIPVEHCMKDLPDMQREVFMQAVHTVISYLSSRGLAIEASDVAQSYGYGTINPNSFDESILIDLDRYLFQSAPEAEEKAALLSIIERIHDAGELDVILEFLYMYDIDDVESPDEIVASIYDEDSEFHTDVLYELLNRAYVAIRWDSWSQRLCDEQEKPSLTRAKEVLVELDSRAHLVEQLIQLIDFLIEHKEVLDTEFSIEYHDEVLRGSSSIIAPCNAAEFEHMGVYNVVNDMYQYGMETSELCDCFVYRPESMACADKAESFKGVLMANAALIYLSHIVCAGAGEKPF